MLGRIRQSAHRGRLFWLLKNSIIYRVYLRCFYPRHAELLSKESVFYRHLAGDLRGKLVFDVGANLGEKAAIFLEAGAFVVCVDPDAECCEMLKTKFAATYGSRLCVVHAAASDREGTITFRSFRDGFALNTVSLERAKYVSSALGERPFVEREVPAVTLDSLIDRFGEPCLIKVDVEGHESHVAGGLSRPVHATTWEVNLPDSEPDALKLIYQLDRIEKGAFFNLFATCEDGLTLPEDVDSSRIMEIIKDFCRSGNEESFEVVWRPRGNQ